MDRLHAYSLAPVAAVAALLFFSAVLHGRNARGLAAYCGAVAGWACSLIFASLPSTTWFGERLIATGGFVVAGYLHAAHDLLEERRRAFVWLAYGVATAIAMIELLGSGWLVRNGAAGPLFWPSMLLALVAAAAPVARLMGVHRAADAVGRNRARRLLAAGLVGYAGAAVDALFVAQGMRSPIGPLIVLTSLLMLARIVRDQQPVTQRKLLDRSLSYSAFAGILSAGFLLGTVSLMGRAIPQLGWDYGAGPWLLLITSAVAFEPLRRHIADLFGSKLLGRQRGTDLVQALDQQETRADQAERLAEIGALTSAVAHEVRGPLGVIAGQLRLLELSGADAEIVGDIRQQVRRTERFVEDMLRYGRPRPIELRATDLGALVSLAVTTARGGLGDDVPAMDTDVSSLADGLEAEVDQAQVLQVFVIVMENAVLASVGRERCRVRIGGRVVGERVCIVIEDDGPGIPEAIAPRIFEPFVTGRKNAGPRPGTGLGLAIAKGIVERHGGTIGARRSELGGAAFVVELPRRGDAGRPS